MSDSAGQIKELKVSGHTMSLDAGLYCVFNAPGSPAATGGLPGVRITLGPSRHGDVSVATFHTDGWIGADEGALVRVAQGPAEVLVTVYQAKGAAGEPPNLQVVKLSGASAERQLTAAAPKQPPARSSEAPTGVEVMAHVYARGDIGAAMGDWLGEPGSQRWIEGFGIAPEAGVPLADIEYQAVLGRGWLSPWSEGGQFCGSRGMSLPILGLRVRLRGASAQTHRVSLSATFVDGTKIGPVGSGEACEAPSLAALEAFLVAFEPLAALAGTPARAKPPKVAAAKAGTAPARGGKVAPKPAKAKPPSPAAKPEAPRGRKR